MISSLLKQIMKKHDLQQVGLAEVMGVSLDRVKSLTSGKVKNLKREESEALINKLGVRAAWLVTGEEPMLESDESQDQFIARMRAIEQMSALLKAMPMQELTRQRLAVLMTGDPSNDGPLIAQALAADAPGADFVTGQGGKAPTAQTAEETMLLEYFRAASPTGRRAAIGALVGASTEVTPAVRDVTMASRGGMGGVQIGVQMGGKATNRKKSR